MVTINSNFYKELEEAREFIFDLRLYYNKLKKSSLLLHKCDTLNEALYSKDPNVLYKAVQSAKMLVYNTEYKH